MRILVSACLLGTNCKYDGGNNRSPAVLRCLCGHEVIPICPEILVLPAPRPPVEIRAGRVVREDGADMDAVYRRGVSMALETIAGMEIDLVILKARSPTCGVHEIYDGSFSHRRVAGAGLLAAALSARGLRVIDEEDAAALLREGGLFEKEEGPVC